MGRARLAGRATRVAGVAAVVALLWSAGAGAQVAVPRRGFGPRPLPPPEPLKAGTSAPVGEPPSRNLKGRFGLDVAARLLRSPDADERLRGLERTAEIRSPEALALLERAAGPGLPGTPVEGLVRSDSRALLVVVRALATWTDKESARMMLDRLLEESTRSLAPNPAAAVTGKDAAAEEADELGRVERAREEAAMALASWGDESALDLLLTSARKNGPWQACVVDAFVAHPPPPAILSGVALTTPATITAAIEAGDLRSLGAILGAVHASDPVLRADAIAALGLAGDWRVVDAAREAGKDKEPRVRLAGADALVRLGTGDAAAAVEALVGDDATALGGLRLAQLVQGEGVGVTKAAAARAVASADPELRAMAVAALGRQAGQAAVTALAALAGDPRLAGDAMDALARSPAAAAMGAIEAAAAVPATRRLAARAYFVRRVVRGQRSARGDALLAGLAASGDGAERAVGTEAQVALGELSLERALADRDPRVRRAAAMGAWGHGDADATAATLLAHLAGETDETTRVVLAAGLRAGDPGGAVPTSVLVERAQAGGPEAPLAAMALARRADEDLSPKVDALLGSHDALLRMHVARGLAASAMRDVTGRLGQAYAFEPAREVRRVLVEALAARTGEDATSPSRQDALELAATLEEDVPARVAAQRALASQRTLPLPSGREVAWLRVVPAEGASLPREMTASVTGQDGFARPVVFDEDGYALVPGLPSGDAQVRMTPRLSSPPAP